MKTSEYFAARAERTADRAYSSAEDIIKELIKLYENATIQIQRDIEVFYARYATENGLGYSEARKQLNARELSDFRKQLGLFADRAKNNTDNQWTKLLDELSYRSRINRLEVLQIQMQQEIELLAGQQQVTVTNHLSDVFEEGYNNTMYSVQTGAEVATAFAKVDAALIKSVVSQDWDGANYSSRIWSNRDKLVSELRTVIPNAIARGSSIQKTSSLLAKRMGVSRFNAERIVRTETAHINQQASFTSYKASGIVDKYKILATLDKRTSEICQGMDGKIFLMSEKQVGVTAPPFHPNCRTTTVVYFEDQITTERIAKNNEGKNIYLPGDTTYEDWAKKMGVSSKGKFKITPVDDRGIRVD